MHSQSATRRANAPLTIVGTLLVVASFHGFRIDSWPAAPSRPTRHCCTPRLHLHALATRMARSALHAMQSFPRGGVSPACVCSGCAPGLSILCVAGTGTLLYRLGAVWAAGLGFDRALGCGALCCIAWVVACVGRVVGGGVPLSDFALFRGFLLMSS